MICMDKKDLIAKASGKNASIYTKPQKNKKNEYVTGYSNPSTWEAGKSGIDILPNPAGGIAKFNAGSGTGDCCDSGGSEGGTALMEDTFFATRYERSVEVPLGLRIQDKQSIEEALDELSPMEEFEVGYLTPVYFYKDLIQKFVLLKATTMTGFTKVDFIDAQADSVIDNDARIQLSKDKIAKGSDKGTHADRLPYARAITDFSADYKSTNTTVKQNHINKDTGENEFETLLFYPKIGSRPKVSYFLDTLKGFGYKKINRDILEQTVLKLIRELLDDVAAGKIKKPRWTESDFIDKLRAGLAQDEATIEAKAFTDTENPETRSTLVGVQNYRDIEKKFPVRALYTNQIFYLKTPYRTLGAKLLETNNLQEKSFSRGHSKEKFHPSPGTRYVRRYYIKPQNIFCSNKEDVLNALIEFEDQDMTIYTMNNLPDDNKDTSKLTEDDIIYYYEDGILFDKNGVKILPLIKIRDEEDREKVDVKKASDKTLRDVYADRLTGLSENIIAESENEFDLDFDSYNAYGEKLVEGKVVGGTCCICGETIEDEPKDAQPYRKGSCCDACYNKFVLPMIGAQE